MEIQFYGANCIKITTKKATIIIDDNLKELGLKSITRPQDILLCTSRQMPVREAEFIATMPGEYEVADASIVGIAARSHMDGNNERSSVMYKVSSGDSTVVIVGHIFPDLSDKQLERIGMVDVLIVPVGNNGYTMDGVGALNILKKVEPKIAIPTHFADPAITFEVEQQSLEEALHSMAMEPTERLPKLKLKGREMTDTTQLLVLERQ